MSNTSHDSKKDPKVNWLLIVVGVVEILFGLMVFCDPIVTFKGGVESDLSLFSFCSSILWG